MEPRELIKKVRRIQIRTSHMVNDVLAGQYHSAFKGRGMEFEEVRPYQIGDDVRTIDWNVSARYGETFVKKYREERELTVMLLVDVSRSQWFGSRQETKRELAALISATLAFSAIQNNDKVGLLLFSDGIEKNVPARKGARHVLRVIRDVLTHTSIGRGTNLTAALDYLNRVQTRRAVVFVISDFLTTGYLDAMRVTRRRHDLIPIVVTDPREMEMPAIGIAEWRDLETGALIERDTNSPTVRRAYAADMRRRVEQRDEQLRRMDVSMIQAVTSESFVKPLQKYFRARRARS